MKLVFAVLFFTLFIFGCSKTDTCGPNNTKANDAEVSALASYITDNNIVATKDSRGFYYHIIMPGDSSKKPNLCNKVVCDYTGVLLNGDVFDEGTSVLFGLNQVIEGWQQGLPLIGAGGSIKLYIPASLAYKDKTTGTIPANSTLVFQVDLKEVLNN
jgi:FKBP-type peptidyl-prolyl cis-trans isomerase FkpA